MSTFNLPKSVRAAIRICLICVLCNVFCINEICGQTMKGMLFDYLDNYSRTEQKIKASKLDSLVTLPSSSEIRIYISGGFKEQMFTDQVVANIYNKVKTFVPDSLSDYSLKIITDNHPIEELVPNAIRKGQKDKSRLFPEEYKGKSWVKNISSPLTAPKGLEGNHIALWQSHGTYWANDKQAWKWQRPHLFCTTEDLFSQTLVIPYIIPMLENAGAIVYTPRERDWQRNEVIVDNDDEKVVNHRNDDETSPFYSPNDSKYSEKGNWQTCDSAGFANQKKHYTFEDHPFASGTAKFIRTTTDKGKAAQIEWKPSIPEKGRYAVYVAYQTVENSTDEAHYTVIHGGTKTEFCVNQQMGGSTWVYLGTFLFDEGVSDENKVVLSNFSRSGGIVTADAVRFGGGMGIILRGHQISLNPETTDSLKKNDSTEWRVYPKTPKEDGFLSYMPRFAEAATYNAWWSGMPDSVYNHTNGANDYNNDLWARPLTINNLAGGSIFMPNQKGRKVPFEMALAIHSDANFSRIGEFIGSLGICSTDYYEGKTDAGVDRYASYDLSSLLINGLNKDLQSYKWTVRQIWNRNYCETRVPQIPSAILETLSHQNFDDLRMGFNPKFKFDFCRSVYKTIVKYLACQHSRSYTIQPLPIHNFAITLNEEENIAQLSWDATKDPLEPTASPTSYILYTREGNGDFDNGILVKSNSYTVKMKPDVQYSFRIEAMNDGGKSFPSETLTAMCSSNNSGTILIVNAFDRLEGPAAINTSNEQGFDLNEDAGIQYGMFAGFCGTQLVFDKKNMGSESTTGTGYSGSELEGKLIMGNTFDYASLHGQGIAATKCHSFTSCSEEAFINRVVIPAEYDVIDVIYGVQKSFKSNTAQLLADYSQHGGNLLISGANIDRIGSNALLNALHANIGKQIKNKYVSEVSGSGLDFHIYRDINDKSYAVPSVLELRAGQGAFPMLVYKGTDSNESFAAIAYNGDDHKAITLGFPIESIKVAEQRDLLMQAVMNFLKNER